MSLNLKKKKQNSNYHRFNQGFVHSDKLNKFSYFHFDRKTSFFSQINHGSKFCFNLPVFNSKLSFYRRDFLGRLVWGMYGRETVRRGKYWSFSTALRLQYFSKINRLIFRSFSRRLFRRRKRRFKRKRMIPLYSNGFAVLPQMPRFLWGRKNLNPILGVFSYYTQLVGLRVQRKRIKFSGKFMRRNWKRRLRLQNYKSKFRRCRRKDNYTISFRVKFIDLVTQDKKGDRWCLT